jgi:hypothetical protein
LQAFWPLQACLGAASAEEAAAGAAAAGAGDESAGAALEGEAAGGVLSAHPVAPANIPPTAAAINEWDTFMMTS